MKFLTKLILFHFRFARVGDNYILKPDPDEQTFRVSKIIKHGQFKPLGAKDGGDGRHDIALVSVLSIDENSVAILQGNIFNEKSAKKILMIQALLSK